MKQGKEIINLGIGNPDLPPPPTVIEALTQGANDLSKHGYQPYKGLPELREAIAIFYQKHYTVTLNYENEILPLAGAKEGIMHISMAFLNPGDAVLVPNPGYASYATVAKMLGAVPILYDLKLQNNWLPDFHDIEKKDLSKVKIMWVNYPNMPTGAGASYELFEELITFAEKHQILLVNDNPYSFILTKKPLSILSINGAKNTALELNSLSKSFNMAGWRVGMLAGAQKHIDTVLKVKSNMDSGMFYGLQTGAIAALNIDTSWYIKQNTLYKQRRKLIWQIASKIGTTYNPDSVGFFVWAKLPEGQNDKQISDYLLQEKAIFVTPGSIFGSNGKGYLRFSLCVPENTLLNVLDRFK
jgi:aspartate/methionine/tyrosine aminotransferase